MLVPLYLKLWEHGGQDTFQPKPWQVRIWHPSSHKKRTIDFVEKWVPWVEASVTICASNNQYNEMPNMSEQGQEAWEMC